MRSLLLATFCGGLFTLPVQAVDRRAIDAAIRNGVAYLEDQYRNGKGLNDAEGIGPVALAGLALLENGKRANDPAIRNITAAVREASYSETRTYQLALCLIYLDRLKSPSDEPRIQMLAVRILAGQNVNGGWTYSCVDAIPRDEEQRLRARIGENRLVANSKGPGGAAGSKPDPPGTRKTPSGSGRLHPEIERHRRGLLANNRIGPVPRDDNSNTQFGILAVWVARYHGVPVEPALAAIEKRFLGSQTNSGGWPYSGLIAVEGSPAMTCAGLLGLATAVGRREERRLKAEPPPRPAPKPETRNPDDPFFTEPPKPKPKPRPKPVRDLRDKAVDAALDNLAFALKDKMGGQNGGRGANPFRFGGGHEMYFLWSLERVGVVFGLNKIRNIDWYAFGANQLIPSQNRDGSWAGGNGREVSTSFALLFLARSNLVRDLSSKVQRDPGTSEMRGGPGPLAEGGPGAEPGAGPRPTAPGDSPAPEDSPKPDPIATRPAPAPQDPSAGPVRTRPRPAGDESGKLASALIAVPGPSWAKALELVRDGKGGDFTKALVLAIHQLDGERKKDAREALANRLTRMSAKTLRRMLAAEDVELRRAATLACAMRDDRKFIPDLIERIEDKEEAVVRAARAGLKSLSGGKDFGPEPASTKVDRQAAALEWKAWWNRQRK